MVHGGVILKDNVINNMNVTTQLSSQNVPPIPQHAPIDPVVVGYPRTVQTDIEKPLAQALVENHHCFSGSKYGFVQEH